MSVKQLEAEAQGEVLRTVEKVLQVKLDSSVGKDAQHLPSSPSTARGAGLRSHIVKNCALCPPKEPQGDGSRWGVSSGQEVKKNGSVFI